MFESFSRDIPWLLNSRVTLPDNPNHWVLRMFCWGDVAVCSCRWKRYMFLFKASSLDSLAIPLRWVLPKKKAKKGFIAKIEETWLYWQGKQWKKVLGRFHVFPSWNPGIRWWPSLGSWSMRIKSAVWILQELDQWLHTHKLKESNMKVWKMMFLFIPRWFFRFHVSIHVFFRSLDFSLRANAFELILCCGQFDGQSRPVCFPCRWSYTSCTSLTLELHDFDLFFLI